MRQLLIAVVLATVPVSAAAQTSDGQTLTVAQVIELSKAGLGEEALLALIEVNRPVFPVDVDTLRRLKDAGVAPNVIVAMIRSGRTEPLPPPELPALPPEPVASTPAAQPPVVVVEHHDEPAVREAWETFDRLGAVPDARLAAARLRELGSQRIPRGPRAATRTNPVGLTAREVEVLSLIVEGKRDREIANQLFLSPRTVAHHVSSILRKLQVCIAQAKAD